MREREREREKERSVLIPTTASVYYSVPSYSSASPTFTLPPLLMSLLLLVESLPHMTSFCGSLLLIGGRNSLHKWAGERERERGFPVYISLTNRPYDRIGGYAHTIKITLHICILRRKTHVKIWKNNNVTHNHHTRIAYFTITLFLPTNAATTIEIM